MQEILLKIRQGSDGEWVTNFSNGGWNFRNSSDTGWIKLTPSNTKVRNASDSGWLQPI